MSAEAILRAPGRRPAAPAGGRAAPDARDDPRPRGLGLGLLRPAWPLSRSPRGRRAVDRRPPRSARSMATRSSPTRGRPTTRASARRRRRSRRSSTRSSGRSRPSAGTRRRSPRAGRSAITSATSPTGRPKASAPSRSSTPPAPGWPIRTKASMPGTSATSSPRAARARPPALARYDDGAGRAAGGGRDPRDRGPPLPGRLELGAGLPARPRPQAPRDARALVRRGRLARSLMPTDRSPGARHRRRRSHDRGDRRGRVAPGVPDQSARARRSPTRPRSAGARQLFTLSLRGTGAPATQITASEKAIGEPQWSPDGRRLAFVRDEEIWIVEADGSRFTKVVPKPGGGRDPQWSPDGRRIAFLSRRRGWSQVWLIDAPVPRRGRPQRDPRPPQAGRADRPAASTSSGWPGPRTAAGWPSWPSRRPTTSTTSQIAIVDVATGKSEVVAGERSHDTGAQWLPDGSLALRVRRRRLVPGRAPLARWP